MKQPGTTVDDFLGRGAAFPLQVDARGGICEAAGVRRIQESLRILLGTQYGERVMRPDFGCNLRSLAFLPNNAATANLAHHYVLEGINRWEPRVDAVDVVVENDAVQNRLLIHIHYAIRATQEQGLLVFPFPLGSN